MSSLLHFLILGEGGACAPRAQPLDPPLSAKPSSYTPQRAAKYSDGYDRAFLVDATLLRYPLLQFDRRIVQVMPFKSLLNLLSCPITSHTNVC